MSDPAVLPTLLGRNLELIPCSKQHIQTLYLWTTDISTRMLWVNRRDIPSFEQYIEDTEWRLKHSVLTQLMIKQRDQSTLIGTIYAYDANLTDGFAYLTVYLVPQQTRRGYGTEVTQLFLDYLSAYYPLRKIYTEVYSYNDRSLAVLKEAGFYEEGCFREHRFFDGQYVDLYRFAMHRRDWPEIRSRYLAAAQIQIDSTTGRKNNGRQ